MAIDKVVKSSSFLLTALGSIFLLIGITLVLMWWPDVVVLFRGFIGIAIALGGLFLLYMAKE
jgi:hypothetical protein